MKKKINRNIVNNNSISIDMYIGESIEQKMERVINNKEAIDATAPVIYTERKDGVRPEFNIRTDRFDIALNAMDAVNRAQYAKSMGIVTHPKTEEIKQKDDMKTNENDITSNE